MKRFFTICAALVCLVAATSCEKRFTFSHGIGLVSEFNILKAEYGSTPILVFSNTNWSARFLSEASWASLDRYEGNGCGEVKFLYSVNYGRSRMVEVEFQGGGETQTIKMWQKPAITDDEVIISLERDSEELSAAAGNIGLSYTTNLVYQKSELKSDVIYATEGDSWVKKVTIDVEDDTVTIECDANPSSEDRSANIRIGHTDAGSYDASKGTYTAPVTIWSNTLTVIQHGNE